MKYNDKEHKALKLNNCTVNTDKSIVKDLRMEDVQSVMPTESQL